MRIYSIEHCLHMIAHYTANLNADGKPARWYELCHLSIATWQWQLERAKA